MVVLISGWFIYMVGCVLVIDLFGNVWGDCVDIVVLCVMVQCLVYQYQCYYCFGDGCGVDVDVGIVVFGGDYFDYVVGCIQ